MLFSIFECFLSLWGERVKLVPQKISCVAKASATHCDFRLPCLQSSRWSRGRQSKWTSPTHNPPIPGAQGADNDWCALELLNTSSSRVSGSQMIDTAGFPRDHMSSPPGPEWEESEGHMYSLSLPQSATSYNKSLQQMDSQTTAMQNSCKTSKFPISRPKCPYCSTTFVDNARCRRHVESVHMKKTFQCPFCTATHSRSDALHRHIKRKHPSQAWCLHQN